VPHCWGALTCVRILTLCAHGTVKLRISSTKNIQKITKSMKMIASTKLVRAQREMQRARVYGKAATAVPDYIGFKPAETGKTLVVAVSSDKGLCGGIHSTLTRGIRPLANANPNVDLMSIGDKCKAQLARQYASRLVGSFSTLGSKPATYTDAALVGSVLLQAASGDKYDAIRLAYNHFQSVISYKLTLVDLPTLKSLQASDKMDAYEVEDDVLQSLQEFTVANVLFAAMSDGYAAEIAAKMSAMDNATSNARDLISKLTIIFNRSRQAAITNELVEILCVAPPPTHTHTHALRHTHTVACA
jgi:F-type H+-transporting ATPase subunit gamma